MLINLDLVEVINVIIVTATSITYFLVRRFVLLETWVANEILGIFLIFLLFICKNVDKQTGQQQR